MIDLASMGRVVTPCRSAEQRVAWPQCAKRRVDTKIGVNIGTGTYRCFRCNCKVRAESKTGAAMARPLSFDDLGVIVRKRERGHGS
jgi:hypothetical protein